MASPHSPLRSIPNSRQKRIPTSALSRTSATPSHASKMSAIFHDAAIPLHNIPTPSRPWSSNTKRGRTQVPLTEARNIHFGTFYSEAVRNQAAAREATPPTPTPALKEMKEEVTYPILPHLPPSSTATNNPFINFPKDTHPEPPKVSPSPSISPKRKRSPSSCRSSNPSSNKENHNPRRRRSSLPRTPTVIRTLNSVTPSPTFRLPRTPYNRQRSNAPSPSPRRRTPPGPLCSPPKRRRVHGLPIRDVGSMVHEDGAGEEGGEGNEDKEAGESEDGEEVETVQLSPKVECYRKGRGPRRDRCRSYWDDDVIRVGGVDTATEEKGMQKDTEVENLISNNKHNKKSAVAVVIESNTAQTPPQDLNTNNADTQNKRFQFMVGRKAKRRS